MQKNIKRQSRLLNEYEETRDLSDRPKEIESCNRQIEKIAKSLDGYIAELNQIYQEEGIETSQDVIRIGNKLQKIFIKSIIEAIDQKQLTDAEMKEFLRVIQQAFKELEQKAPSDSAVGKMLQESQNLPEVWESPTKDTGEKLKVSIPIIPSILTYEAELSVNVKESLKKFWKKFQDKIK